MTYTLYLQTSAILDLREAFDWYEEQKPGLGNELLSTMDDVLAQIEQNPFLNEKVFRQKRRAVIRRFPYNVIYEVQGELIRVSAIAHGKQDPKQWQKRK